MWARRDELKRRIVEYWEQFVRPKVKLSNDTYTVDLVFDPINNKMKIGSFVIYASI